MIGQRDVNGGSGKVEIPPATLPRPPAGGRGGLSRARQPLTGEPEIDVHARLLPLFQTLNPNDCALLSLEVR
jgi:hypothetical protein